MNTPKQITYPHRVVQNSNMPLINKEINLVNKGNNEISIINKKAHKVTIFKVEKAIRITYSVCVLVTLGIQHAMRLCHIVICGVSTSVILFPHYLINGMIFGKIFFEYKLCVLIFYTILSETFLIIRKI
jgi:hypothetical protein